MKLILSLFLFTPLLAQAVPVDKDTCEWNAGSNAYTGDKELAVDQMTHIPVQAREEIKRKMRAHSYDDKVTIYKDRVEGEKGTYTARVSNMRFGTSGRCKEVSREKWSSATSQTALVYTAGGYSVIDPSVCRNIAQIYEAPPPVTFSLPPIDPVNTVSIPEIPSVTPVTFADFTEPESPVQPILVPVVNWTVGDTRVVPITVTPVPEPSSLAMLLVGLVVLGFRSLREKTLLWSKVR